MSDFFAHYARLIVFFHLFFAVVWVGGMIALRFSVHQAVATIDDKHLRFGVVLKYLGRFFQMIVLALSVIGITGFIMLKAQDSSAAGIQVALMHIKTQIWTMMTMVFGYIYFKYTRASAAYDRGDIDECAKELVPIAKYLIPTNIALGVLALFLGVIVRGY